MAELRATEWWSGGRQDEPSTYVTTAASPVEAAPGRYVSYGSQILPSAPSPHGFPPPPHVRSSGYPHAHESREPYPPPIYAAVPAPADRAPAYPLPHDYRYQRAELRRPVHQAPPYDSHLRPIEPGMAIPGVQYPDGRFEPYDPALQRAVAPVTLEEQALGHGKRQVEVQVPVCCEACEDRITNYLFETEGVDAVSCDLEKQKVVVTGDLGPTEVLQRCRKCFKKSTLV